MSYQNKYLKYKKKYLDLKNLLAQKGGANPNDNAIVITPLQTLLNTNMVKSVAVYITQTGEYRIVSSGYSPNIKIWSLDQQGVYTLFSTLDNNYYDVISTAVYKTQDGEDRIVSGDYNFTLKIWDANTGECLQRLESPDDTRMRSVVVYGTGDSLRIVSDNANNTIKIWNPNTGAHLDTLHAPGFLDYGLRYSISEIYSLAVYKNRILSGGRDCTIKIWDLNTGDHLRTLGTLNNTNPKLGHINTVTSLAVYGNYIISGSDDSTIKIWKLDTGAYVRTIGTSKYNDRPWSLGHDCISSVAVYEEGSAHRIVSASRDHTIKIWDLKSGNCLYTLAGPNGHTEPVTSVAIRKTPDGGCLIVSGSTDRTVKIWHTKSIDELCNWYRIKYEQLLYPNYEATFPQDLTPFCSELQTVLSDVRLKAKSLFPLHLLFHKFVYLDNEYTYDLLDILLDINRI